MFELFESFLLMEDVSKNDVKKAIDDHRRVLINYNSGGDSVANGVRVIEVYAYGRTNKGFDCIRAFQPYGDTASTTPSWKLFRMDRVSYWEETDQTFDEPRDGFNPSGDSGMSLIYKIASFKDVNTTPKSEPKDDGVFRTSSEIEMGNKLDRFDKNVSNALNLDKLKSNNGWKKNEPKPKEGAREPEVFKTDSEKLLDYLSDKNRNPRKIDLSQFGVKGNTKQEQEKDVEKLRDILKTEKNINLKDLAKKMKEPDVYRTDSERQSDELFNNNMNATRKIDLSTIPRR